MAQSLIERVQEIRAMRDMVPGWKRIHQAADLHRPAFEAHMQRAFKKALDMLGPLPTDEMVLAEHMSEVMEVFEKNLQSGLEDLILDTMNAGGNAAAITLMMSPLMRTSQGFYKPTLVLLRSALATHRINSNHGEENG